MATYIIMGILLIICVLVIFRYVRQLRRGDSCCSIGKEPVKKVWVADRNKSNFPYILEININVMTCANCAVRVENALNSLPDVWTQVDLGRKIAVVRSKSPVQPDIICKVVRQSGYIVTEINN